MTDKAAVDYIVIGAGSAGCVLANRLSADPGTQVLLLEAGGDDRPWRNPGQFWSNVMVQTPIGFARTLKDPKLNWLFETEPDPSTGDRRHLWPKGRVLGGSSSINGLLYIRGQARDYDDWAAGGCPGWSWQEVLPSFRRSQHQVRGESECHGVGGPLHVSDQDCDDEVCCAIVEAFVQGGVPRSEDVNTGDQEGVTRFQATTRGGRRCSAAVAYLHPVMKRPNLRVETNAVATRILFEDRRAVGVEYLQDGVLHSVRAGAEVLLSGGAVNSPQLLELSGIGAGGLLTSHGIEVLVDNPAVGENMQDHYMIGMQWRLNPGAPSVNSRSRGLGLLREIGRYAVSRQGLLSYAVAQFVAFCKSDPALDRPDIQFHMMSASMDLEALQSTQTMQLEREPGLTITPCQVRPESRGSIHIRSADPLAHPGIVANYLAHPVDQQVALAGIRLARHYASQPALARYIDHATSPPLELESDEQLLNYARLAGGTLYHAAGTCRMGSDEAAVVDPLLRVRGVEGLRVVDASIMPRITSGNTNAPTIMIAERAAELILGEASAAGAASA